MFRMTRMLATAGICAAVLFVTSAAAPAQTATPTYHIQLWDAQKTNWEDAKLQELSDMGFTVAQNGYKGSFFPSKALLERLGRHGLVYGAYINTLELFRWKATSAEKAAALRASNPDGTYVGGEYNSFDATYNAVVRRAMSEGLKSLVGVPGLHKIMLNSEREAPISYDALTKSKAMEAGVLQPWQLMPLYNRGVWKLPTGMSASQYAQPYNFVKWYDNFGGDGVPHKTAVDVVRALMPGVRLTTDPLDDRYTYGQYRNMNVLQDWVRVHNAPRDPLSIVYRTERLKANARALGGGQVWIGPQLGTADGATVYAAPADVFEEALWLAVGFGADGATMWGYNAIRRSNALDRDTWGRIKKFSTTLNTYLPMLKGAADTRRDCAVLFSKGNQVYTRRPYYDIDDSYEHFYRILLTAHVPADVIYDEDVLAGKLSNYKAVFLPGLEAMTAEVKAALDYYRLSGGRVVAYQPTLCTYKDYEIVKGNYSETLDITVPSTKSMLPHQYRAWRRYHAAKLFAAAADIMKVRCDNPDVIMNVIESQGSRYVVLINDRRTYGAWTAERRYRVCEDDGLEAIANVTLIGNDGNVLKKVLVPIPAGGIRLVKL